MKHYLWHRFIFRVLRAASPLVRHIMGYSCCKQKGPDLPSLIISNHNTDLDPALVAMGFSRHMYFVSSEHTFRAGFVSKVLKFIFAPIPINKARIDITAIKEMLRRLKAGANVCLFAEGDRSFDGVTGPVLLSTAKLAKSSGAELITFRLEGGYFTQPRWSTTMRKGAMSGAIVNKYSAAELKSMTDEQVLEAIERDIYEDAYERQKTSLERFRGKNPAESIETVLYLCPSCKKIGSISSGGDKFACSCGLSGGYTEMGFLEGEALPFSTITEWSRWQREGLWDAIRRAGDGPICADDGQQFFEVRPAIDKTPAGVGAISIDREAFHFSGKDFPLPQITRFVIVGQMTMIFATKDGATYEIRGTAPRSALKYKEIFQALTETEAFGGQ